MWICLLHRTNLSMGTLLLPRGAGDSRAFVPCDQHRTEGQAGGSWDWPLPPGPTRTPSTPRLSQPGSSTCPFFPWHRGHGGTARPWSTALGWGPECSPTDPKWATVLRCRAGEGQQQRLLWPWCFLSLVEWDCQPSTPRAPSPSCCTENQPCLTWFQPVFLHD